MSIRPDDACATPRLTLVREPSSSRGLRKGALARAHAYIDGHLFCPLRLEGVANAAGVSRYHFSRCFTLSMGMTFVEYVARRRIEAAQHALCQDPWLDLAALAADLGFCDQAHFSNVFRRVSGTTPKRFANQARHPRMDAARHAPHQDRVTAHELGAFGELSTRDVNNAASC